MYAAKWHVNHNHKTYAPMNTLAHALIQKTCSAHHHHQHHRHPVRFPCPSLKVYQKSAIFKKLSRWKILSSHSELVHIMNFATAIDSVSVLAGKSHVKNNKQRHKYNTWNTFFLQQKKLLLWCGIWFFKMFVQNIKKGLTQNASRHCKHFSCTHRCMKLKLILILGFFSSLLARWVEPWCGWDVTSGGQKKMQYVSSRRVWA
jgi:hypothetical protein